MPNLRSGPALGSFGVVAVAVVAVAVLLMVHNADSRTLGGRGLNAQERHGAELFAKTCAECHALVASKSNGMVGPSLDYVQPTERQVRAVITSGSQGAYNVMPAGLLTGSDAQAVAAYVARVANRKNIN